MYQIPETGNNSDPTIRQPSPTQIKAFYECVANNGYKSVVGRWEVESARGATVKVDDAILEEHQMTTD